MGVKRSIIVLVVAIIVVFSGPAIYLHYDHPSGSNLPLEPITFGPRLSIYTVTSEMNVTGTEAVQVFSEMPSSFIPTPNLSAYNLSNNSRYVELLNLSFPYNGNVTTTFLSPTFIKIADEWVSILKNYQGKEVVSLSLESTLSIVKNSTLYVYSFYNNIPYSPFKVNISQYSNNSTWFSNSSINPSEYSSVSFVNLSLTTKLSFDLEKPDFVQKLNSSSPELVQNSPLSLPPPPTCQPGTYYEPTSTNYTTGPFPLVASEISLNNSNAISQLIDSAAFVNASLNLNLNSNQVDVSNSGEVTNEMSTSPAYNSTANIYVQSSPPAYPANTTIDGQTTGANETIAMISIQNSTIEAVHGIIIYEYLSGSNCYEEVMGNYTYAKVSLINTASGFKMKGSYLPIEASTVIGRIFNNNVSMGTLSPNNEVLGSTVWYDSQGYSNANSEYQKVVNTLKTFAESLGLTITIIEIASALNTFGDEGEPAVISGAVKLISGFLSLSTSLASMFSSIDFVSDTSINGFGYGVTNYALVGSGSSFSLIDHESTAPVTFDVNGTEYTFNAPVNYINAF